MKMKFDNDGKVAIAEDGVNFNTSGVYPGHRLWEEKVQPFLKDGKVIAKHVKTAHEIARENDARENAGKGNNGNNGNNGRR